MPKKVLIVEDTVYSRSIENVDRIQDIGDCCP